MISVPNGGLSTPIVKAGNLFLLQPPRCYTEHQRVYVYKVPSIIDAGPPRKAFSAPLPLPLRVQQSPQVDLQAY